MTTITDRQKTHEAPLPGEAEAERWWWDEVGVLVEHEVWHLPQLADEQAS